MKRVVHVNAGDGGGGAAIAARRHCEAQRAKGVDARLLTVMPTCGEPWVEGVAPRREAFVKVRINNWLNHRKAARYNPYATWSYAAHGFDVAAHPLVREADEVWLHWVNGGMLSVKGVEDVLRLSKPVVWYLHDMWPMTGGCHYSFDCQRYTHGCGACPMLGNRRGSDSSGDISARLLKEKLRRWSRYDNLRIVAPSQWLASCAGRSTLFSGRNISVKVNPLDTARFCAIDRSEARRALGLPVDKPLIAFGAANPLDAYKGWPLLQEALAHLAVWGDEVECVLFGNAPSQIPDSPLPLHPLGRFTDSVALRLVYSAADLFVSPSVADNYPNVLVEAMACGTGCVGFPIGGVPEIIRNGSSGYIADGVNGISLARVIRKGLENAAEIGRKARLQVENINSYERYEV